MDRINELLARLADLTADELTELLRLLDEELAASEEQDVTAELVAHLGEVADAIDQARAEQGRRDEVDADLQRQRADILQRVRPADVADATDGDTTDDEPATEDVSEPVAAAADPAPASNGSTRVQPVRLSGVARRQPRQDPPPREQPTGAVLTAAGTTQPITDAETLTRAIHNRMMDVRRGIRGHDGERIVVASSRWTYPEDRRLRNADADHNSAAIDAVTAALQQAPITAAGGICRPVAVDYAIPTIGSADRPFRDSLPAFNAERGGVRFVSPVAFTPAALAGGVAIWTEANDRAPGAANTGPGGVGTGPTTKPCVEIDCGTEVEVLVEAITACLTVGNMRARFNPEQVAAVTGYLTIQHASIAEQELLRQARAASKHVSTAQKYGASRDLLSAVDLAVAGYRDRFRIPAGVRLAAQFPHWARELIRVDLARASLPYEGDTPPNSLAVSDEQIVAWFAARNITVTFVLDSDQADQRFAAQGAGTQAAPVALSPFPATVRWLLYAEGTFQFLDGGQLDLGVVRDSQLNAVNKYQLFSETFEGLAFRGFESLDITSTVLANGATAGTIAPVA